MKEMIQYVMTIAYHSYTNHYYKVNNHPRVYSSANTVKFKLVSNTVQL